jgi:beta-1,4-mannosyl-glycoprotein beta-1,4-N-acetylglucosaminyltransferase
MIYDCFTFFNELDLLEIRLHELNPVVDKFILVEATVTHTNKPKPLFYDINKSRFAEFKQKIIHVIVNDCPNVLGNPWIIDMYQNNAITRALTHCQTHDIILISSVDEIPKPKAITDGIKTPGRIKAFDQGLYYYFLNLQTKGETWQNCRMIKFGDMKKSENPYIIRFSPINEIIPDGGWHFSFMGGAEKIREKIFAYAHQEYNNPAFNTPEKIKAALINQTDLFNRNIQFQIAQTETLPKYVQENQSKFKNLFLEKSVKQNLLHLKYLKAIGEVKNIFRKIKT